MKMEELQWVIDKLELRPGDVVLIDPRSVDIEIISRITTSEPHWIVCVYPSEGRTLKECVDTVELEFLKKVVKEMEAAP